MKRRLVIPVGILLLMVLVTLLLWRQAFLLSILLILLAYWKHRLFPIKREFGWFVLVCLTSWAAEVVLVNVGQAWSYSNPHIFGVPVYAPLLWGGVGTTAIVIYEELMRGK